MKVPGLKELLKLTPEALSRASSEDLLKVARGVQKIANKRITRLQEENLNPKTLQNLMKYGGKISATKDMTEGQLQGQIKRGLSFIKNPNSQKAHAKKELNEVVRKYGLGKYTTSEKSEIYKQAWKAVDKLREISPGFEYRVVGYLGGTDPQVIVDDIIDRITTGDTLESTIEFWKNQIEQWEIEVNAERFPEPIED